MPRKPVQQRSLATVDAILEAGFVCVARHGVANTTTRKIAQVAGIGVGSLYEYFANKEEVFDAMNRRFVDDVVEFIREITPELLELELQPALELLFRRFGDFLTRDDERYLKVAPEVVQTDTKGYVEPVSKALLELMMQYVLKHPELMRMPDLQTTAYVLINAGIFTVLRHLSSESPPITFEQLSAGLATLVSSYAEHTLGHCGSRKPRPRRPLRTPRRKTPTSPT
ncbi:MAG: TetR/AcrR family transcriptional regulator [Polyangiaceae bacterium]|nr:TetR/AcrR family transcriptional regulator [Polyangiaceae bacterium]